jgi:hypothetical protein
LPNVSLILIQLHQLIRFTSTSAVEAATATAVPNAPSKDLQNVKWTGVQFRLQTEIANDFQVQKKRHHCRSAAAVCEKTCQTCRSAQQLGFVLVSSCSETQPASRSTSAHHIGCLILCESQWPSLLSCAARTALVDEGICSRSCAGGDGRRMQMQMQGVSEAAGVSL